MSATHLSVVDGSYGRATSPGIELINEYCSQADVVASTRERQRVQLKEFAIWLAHPKTRRSDGPASLLDARRPDAVRFNSYLMAGERYAAPNHFKRRPVLSAGTRKNFLATLHSFYDYLITVELVTTNPTDAMKRPRQKATRGLSLTAEEVRRLLDAPGSARDRIQVFLLAFTAARANEIRDLRWRDVDFASRTLVLQGKGGKYRVLDIHPRLMPELRRWRVYCDHEVEKLKVIRDAREKPDTNFVLLTRNGKQLPDTTIYKQLKRRAVKAELYVLDPAHREQRSEVSPHALRRTFATLLLNEGHHIDAVADVLGHSSIDTTRKHYAFSSDARRKATIEGFDV